MEFVKGKEIFPKSVDKDDNNSFFKMFDKKYRNTNNELYNFMVTKLRTMIT